MKKVLKIINPPIETFLGYACSLAIILQFDKGVDWFIQNYTNILTLYSTDYDTVFMDFFNISDVYFNAQQVYQPDNFLCPPLKTYSLPKKIIPATEIIEFIKNQIDNGYYLCIFVNRKYLLKHNINNIMHDIFIYGYDDECGNFNICDYYNYGRFSEETCSYQEIIDAYKNADDSLEDNAYFYHNTDVNRVNLLSYNEKYIGKFDKDFLIRSLQYYVKPDKFSVNFGIHICPEKIKGNLHYCLGNDNFKVLEKYIVLNMENKKDIDSRQIHLFYEHKTMHNKRIQYLLKKNFCIDKEIIEDSKIIEEKAMIMRNLVLKYDIEIKNITDINVAKYIYTIKQLLNEIYELEINIINKLVKVLKQS